MPESVTDQREDEELGDALDGELLVSVAYREEPPTNPGNAHAEGAGRRGGEGRNVVGDDALIKMEKALVPGGDESLHVSIGRKFPRRYSFDPTMVVGKGSGVHGRPSVGEYLPVSTRWPAAGSCDGQNAGGADRASVDIRPRPG